MIRFRVYENGKPIRKMGLKGSHLFAQDEIPVRSQLEFVEGELMGVRQSDTAVGLSTLWPVKDFGKVLLQTTRLPERDEPYNLNLEVARGRLLRLNQKREDWSMNELSLTERQYQMIDESLEHFIKALCHMDEQAKASVFADEALSLAVRAGEEMAMRHAELFLSRRKETQGFGRHAFGCCIDPDRMGDPRYLEQIKENFHFVTVPLNWKQVEPKEQVQNFDKLDACVEWLSKNRIAVKVGPLITFSPVTVPDWLYIWENDFEQVREMAYDFVTRVVERYGNRVQAWSVVSGLNAENCFKFSFDQLIEMTRSLALAAKRASHRSLVLVEVAEPWGEYYAYNPWTIPPLIYADMVCQSGVNFDGFDIQIRFGRGAGGMQTRDMLEFSALLDRLSVFGKPLHLSGVQVPSAPDQRDNNGRIGEAGCWHNEWNPQTQAQWLEQVYTIALSKPAVETVTWRDLADREDGVLQEGGLLTADLKAKPAFESLLRLKGELVRQGRNKGNHSKAEA